MANEGAERLHSVVPYLRVRGAAKAIEFYATALGAREELRLPTPDGRIMHACLAIGDSILYLSDEFPEMGGAAGAPAGVTIHLNVPDCDALWQRAMAAGATATMPLADMFWGDRYGKFKDPFGHEWSVSTHKEDVSPTEMQRRAKDAYAKMAAKS